MLFIYGITVVVLGWKGNQIIKKFARIREVTYIFVMFVPIFYNAIPLTWSHILATVLFFPIFYYVIEFIDRITPNPKPLDEDINSERSFGNMVR